GRRARGCDAARRSRAAAAAALGHGAADSGDGGRRGRRRDAGGRRVSGRPRARGLPLTTARGESMKRRALVAGNWKMNGSRDSNASLVHDITFEIKRFPDIDVLICPPAPYLDAVGRQLEGSSIQLGGQNLCE